MSNSLAKKFNFSSLLKFTMPTIIMMVFMSLYMIVDGVFVSRFVGTNALSAVNIVYPLMNIVLAVAIMLATGGSAIIAKKMGEGKTDEARENFSLLMIIGIAIGLSITILGIIFLKPIINMLGATNVLFDYCYDYTLASLLFIPFMIIQLLFQYFFVTAGKPSIGLILTVIGGLSNIILDYVLIVPLDMGIRGAAIATGIGYLLPAICGIIYFLQKKGTLYFTKPKWDLKVIINSCINGSSEMVTNLSTGVTTFLFNISMMKYLGENGVAAMTIVLYGQFLLTAVYLGFSSGVAPVISYNYGNNNKQQLRKIFQISTIFIIITSLLSFGSSILLSSNIVHIFANVDSEVYNIAINGFLLFSFSFLVTGINIFASAMFTAYSNGTVSAIISFLRTFVFIIVGIMFLPLTWGVNGIWLAVPLAELLTLIVSLICFVRYRHTYGYVKAKSMS